MGATKAQLLQAHQEHGKRLQAWLHQAEKLFPLDQVLQADLRDLVNRACNEAYAIGAIDADLEERRWEEGREARALELQRVMDLRLDKAFQAAQAFIRKAAVRAARVHRETYLKGGNLAHRPQEGQHFDDSAG